MGAPGFGHYNSLMLRRLAIPLLLSAIWLQTSQPSASAQTQAAPVAEQVRAIASPRNPLPAESASAAVTRFSFLVYGDTRGRRDGVAEQYEHSLIVDSQIATIKRLADSPAPVKFVLQTGDAVVNGGDARQWNRSFVDLINRITTEGGIPYSSRRAITMSQARLPSTRRCEQRDFPTTSLRLAT